uniref:Transmembrane protein 186 n=1 Tax=Culex pipiens TaxID=7175 RepID=A0A8D8G8W5_CULPI
MLQVLRSCPLSRISLALKPTSSPAFRSFSGLLVRQCSTKSSQPAAPEKVTQNEPPSHVEDSKKWYTLYHFRGIMLTAAFKRLKLYPAGLTAVTVPTCLALAYADICSVTTAQIFGSVGFTTTLTLLAFSYFTNNLVGYVYTDDEGKQVKISYVDPGGKRQNRIYPVDNIVPRSELQRTLLKFYFPIKNHDNGEVYRIVHRYGEVYDEKTFTKVFGRE